MTAKIKGMSNLPNTQNVVLNPKTNKPLVRGSNGRFVKSTTVFDSKKNDNDTPVATNSPVKASPPTPITSRSDALNQVPQNYVGMQSKEILPGAEEIMLQDAEKTKELKEQIKEMEKSAEVKEISEEIELPEDVKNIGVKPVGEETPVFEEKKVEMPLSDDKIYSTVHKNPVAQDASSSLTWLAIWCYRQLTMLGVKLKTVHGKLSRQNINN